MELVGIAEVARRFGISKQLAYKWARKDDFPAPLAELESGRVWDLEEVERWAKTWEPANRRLTG